MPEYSLSIGVALFGASVGVAGSVAAGPLEDGVAAYWQGDYATALRLIRPARMNEATATLNVWFIIISS
jgi:hypothetical protein